MVNQIELTGVIRQVGTQTVDQVGNTVQWLTIGSTSSKVISIPIPQQVIAIVKMEKELNIEFKVGSPITVKGTLEYINGTAILHSTRFPNGYVQYQKRLFQ